ncbi:electron transport complex, RnfABCDGE type, B subunit [Desulfonispora thiosulfatigenes DSM 11270]|uniref:Ion-translocating oxidoreductase complex subunit B n=1 Tax=Desulfonispora thiosulfatigenes DSM 11270 TaxID=656914 RepID=A0A1W1UJ05_DESTI|nr:RnfABCDGE type electron transport complex subunit B [Desulfonispora thiosulfatigenes]SMB80993.1 electron transport complex, RnfABCDGE type, B subunit [Desulfonispora thiosulfatigenes DSM 11270]
MPAVLSLAALGLVLGVLLAVASQKLRVEVNQKIGSITEVLPGANCGACGFPGCSGLAEAIVNGEASVDACVPGKEAVAKKVAELMGVEVTNLGNDRKVAQLRCNGGLDNCTDRFIYEGIQDCKAAANIFNGQKSCEFACLGFGTCANVCPFNAITMGENNLPIVDYDKCTGCKKCVDNCPKHVLELVGISHKVHVRCSSTEKAKDARSKCKVACIKCKICERNCPTEAIKVLPMEKGGSLAVIDYDKCTNCGICVEKCPNKTIHLLDCPIALEPSMKDKPVEEKSCATCPAAVACGKTK